MRIWMRWFLLVFFLSGILLFMLYKNNSFSDKSEIAVSPIPDFFNIFNDKKMSLADLWLPFIEQSFGNEGYIPNISAKSILMYDLTTDTTLFERNARTRVPMASITKIMTAIIALENPKEDDRYLVRSEHLVGENSMGIEKGEVFTLEELLYGLFLKSGNDASEVLASYHPNGREVFLDAMNEKAKVMGLKDTSFSNPSGLQGDGVQHSTPHDLLVISRYAIENHLIITEIASTFEIVLPANNYHREYYLQNETNLISTYPGVKGLKTGYTPEAGMCLVTYLEYGDHRIIGIILDSDNRRQEMKELLDYSLLKLGIQPPEFQG